MTFQAEMSIKSKNHDESYNLWNCSPNIGALGRLFVDFSCRLFFYYNRGLSAKWKCSRINDYFCNFRFLLQWNLEQKKKKIV